MNGGMNQVGAAVAAAGDQAVDPIYGNDEVVRRPVKVQDLAEYIRNTKTSKSGFNSEYKVYGLSYVPC